MLSSGTLDTAPEGRNAASMPPDPPKDEAAPEAPRPKPLPRSKPSLCPSRTIPRPLPLPRTRLLFPLPPPPAEPLSPVSPAKEWGRGHRADGRLRDHLLPLHVVPARLIAPAHSMTTAVRESLGARPRQDVDARDPPFSVGRATRRWVRRMQSDLLAMDRSKLARAASLFSLLSIAAACGGQLVDPIDDRVKASANDAARVDGSAPSAMETCHSCGRPRKAPHVEGSGSSRCTDDSSCSAPVYACTAGSWHLESETSCAVEKKGACPDLAPSKSWCPYPQTTCRYTDTCSQRPSDVAPTRTYECTGSRWTWVSSRYDAACPKELPANGSACEPSMWPRGRVPLRGARAEASRRRASREAPHGISPEDLRRRRCGLRGQPTAAADAASD